MEVRMLVFLALMVITTPYCCWASNYKSFLQLSSTCLPKPPWLFLPVPAPPTSNNPLYCPPPAPTATSGTTYTNTMGIQLQVAPPVVVNMDPDAPLPVYTPNPSFQDIQFSSHPRPTVVTIAAEDPEPAEPVTRA
ncbi:hypothetical protein BKA57DRAFT_499134 [Linnemannia elongata]|nr:hypothetical protein BKA57DRAFT_499134 [Linnemannia elongata]